MGIRHEDRRRACSGELPDGAPCPRHGEIGGRERVAEVVGLGEQDVARPLDPGAEGVVVALTADVEHGGAFGSPGARRRARSATGHRRGRRRRRRPGRRREARTGRGPPHASPPERAPGSAGRRPRSATTVAPGIVGEEHAARERRSEAVGEAEMGVRLRQRRRDARSRAARTIGRRRSRRRRARRRAGGRRIRRTRTAPERHRASAREPGESSSPRKPETANVSSSKPASGTSRDSTRSGDPANVTATPRARSASATASAGRT